MPYLDKCHAVIYRTTDSFCGNFSAEWAINGLKTKCALMADEHTMFFRLQDSDHTVSVVRLSLASS